MLGGSIPVTCTHFPPRLHGITFSRLVMISAILFLNNYWTTEIFKRNNSFEMSFCQKYSPGHHGGHLLEQPNISLYLPFTGNSQPTIKISKQYPTLHRRAGQVNIGPNYPTLKPNGSAGNVKRLGIPLISHAGLHCL